MLPRQGSVIGQRSTPSTSPRKTRPKAARTVTNAAQVSQIKFMPEATWQEDNGWQMRCEDVKSRIASLFNCYTMSDVIFQVEVHRIPAHKLVLASASPVFHNQLYQGPQGSESIGTGSFQRSGSVQSDNDTDVDSWVETGQTTLSISDVPHLAFFEFLQYIYTDNVNITLDNVLHLIFLADTYQVAGLSGRCYDFIRSAVVPGTVLRVLHILRTLMLKSCVSCWKELVDHNKAVERFRNMTLAERRAKLEEMGDAVSSPSSSLLNSRRNSNFSTGSRRWSGNRSQRSNRSSITSWGGTACVYDSSEEEGMSCATGDSVFEGMGKSIRKSRVQQNLFTAEMAEINIATYVEELEFKCWKCVQEHTEHVLMCSDLWDQDVRMLRRILRLECSSVSEISFFRAMNEWAERRCKKNGRDSNTEGKKTFLGEDTIELVRFPVMTLEQFQWEVIPTGMLNYEEVNQVLYSLTQKAPYVGRFVAAPRSNVTLRPQGSRRPTELGKSLYQAVPGDALDCMLSAELLRVFLQQHVDGSEPKLPSTPRPVTSPRLPPIRVAGLGGKRPEASEQVRRQDGPGMIMGQRVDTTEAAVGTYMLQGGGRRPQPRDFLRLAPGVYRFRGGKLVEIWVEDGEPFVKDHGYHPALQDIRNIAEDPAAMREQFGLQPEAGPRPYRGVPLHSFLCRQ